MRWLLFLIFYFYFVFTYSTIEAQYVGLPANYVYCLEKGGQKIEHKGENECKFIINKSQKPYLFNECKSKGGNVVEGLATICAMSLWSSGKNCPSGRCKK